MSIEDRAREFIDRHVKKLPLPVRLNGITEAEKQEAASICTEFASIEREAAVREFIEKMYGKTPPSDRPLRLWAVFREMFNKEID